MEVTDGKDAAGVAEGTPAKDDDIAVTINLTNVDEAGTVAIMGMEKGGQTLTATLSDPDGNLTGTTWQWKRSDTSGGTFSNISGATSNTYRLVAADVTKFLKATASYTDGEGSGKTASSDETGAITASNAEPAFDDGATATRAVDENTAANTTIGTAVSATDTDTGASLTYALTGTDASSFDIDTSTGQIKTKDALDHETEDSYSVNVTVHDGLDAASDMDTSVDDTIAVTITVNDVNEAPTITTSDTMKSVPENSTAVLTLAASDVDTDSGNTLTWSVESAADGGKFSINPSSGALTFTNAPDFETPEDVGDTAGNNTYVVTVKVTDNGIDGNRDSSNHLSDTHMLTVTVTDINERPVIAGEATPGFDEIEYDLDVTATELVIGTYSATDDDNTDNVNTDADYQTITWGKSGTDSAHFSIDSTTGVLSFSIEPDYEVPVDLEDSSMMGAADNDYMVVVEANDGQGETNSVGTFTVTITVNDVNERPVISEDTVPDYMEIEYDSTSTRPDVHDFSATDYENDTVTWSLHGTDAGDFEIIGSGGVVTFKQNDSLDVGPLPNFEQPQDDTTDGSSNTYNVTLRATDDDPTDSKSSDYAVVITVLDVNERPRINEVTNDAFQYTEVDFYFTGTPDNVHTFTATDYDDMDTFTWSLSGGADSGDFSIGSISGILTFNQVASLNVGPLPSYEDPQDDNTDNTYSLTVRATDDDTSDQKFSDYSVTIAVTDEEEAGGIAVAHLRMGDPIDDLTNLEVDDVLEFTLSDPDTIPTPLTDGAIDWSIERSNPGEMNWVALTGQDVTSLTKTYTVNEDDTGKKIRATVTYTDRLGSGKTAESDNTDAAADERVLAPPRFRTGDVQTIPEGDAGRNTLEIITATDRDGEALIFGLTGQDSHLFEIIPSDSSVVKSIDLFEVHEYTAQLRAIEALDHETLSPKTFDLTVTLSDGRHDSNGRIIYDDVVDDTYPITITVSNVEEPGEITLSPEEVPEPGVAITATLADGDGSISGESWQWQRSEEDEEEANWSDITGATFSTYTPSGTDDVTTDGEGYYLRATVSYTDGEGSGKSADAIAGQVGTANTRPTFPDAETGQRTVPENSRAGTSIGDPVAAEDPENNSLTYTLTGDDAELFTIVSGTGQLRVRDPLDFETMSTYSVTVNVHDRRDAAGASSTIVDATRDVRITVENVDESGTVTLTSPTGTTQATVPVAAALSDPDNPGSVSWEWHRSSNRSTWTETPIATGDTYTPTEADDLGNYLRATATYTGVDGSDQTAEVVSPRVGGLPPTNSAPVFPDAEDGQREVAENSASGTAIGDPVAATDHNSGDTLTYTLSGSDSASFTINVSNGQLSVGQDAELDYERKRTYRFTVQVSDGNNQDGNPDNGRVDDSISVTVSLTDVNEPPAITGESEREFRENNTSPVATYSARDPEGDTVKWSVTVADAGSFVITDRGQLYFSEPPSFEARMPSVYNVTVTATDDDGLDETPQLSASMQVTVTVTDVEERGEIILQPTKGWFAEAVPDDMETPDIDESLPALATRFTATLTDGDGIQGDVMWQWARSSSEDIEGATTDSYIATAEDVNRTLRLTAAYEDGRSTDPMDPDNVTEKTATASLRSSIRGTSPGLNTQPEFSVPEREESPESRFDTRTIVSGAVARRAIGPRVSAKDPDGDVLTYRLRGRHADRFEIDTATGQLYTKVALDYQEQDTYTLSVSVHDGFDSLYRPSESIDDTISIIITVTEPPPPRRRVRRTSTVDDTPPNRPPEFSDGDTTNRSVLQGSEAGTDVGRPVAASDPDGDSLTYTLEGTDAESIDIDTSTGQLKTKAEADLVTESSYLVAVSVTDGKNAGGGKDPTADDTITVNITVTGVELSEIATKYDADEDGLISRDEALAALNDYFDDGLTLDQVLEIVVQYFDSPAIPKVDHSESE